MVIVHDYLGQFGGAERVVQELCRVFPGAPVYTSYYAPDNTYDFFRSVDVRTSFLRHAPGIAKHYRKYLLLYPIAFSALKPSDCEFVISSTTSFAKGVRTPLRAIHICYCNSPMRFAWDLDSYTRNDDSINRGTLGMLRSAAFLLLKWDRAVNSGVDLFVANSHNVAERIKRYYGRDSIVVYPPVDLDRFHPVANTEDFYLVVSRLAAYKRVDLAVDACTRTGRRLIVVGEGPDRARLETLAGSSVSFLGRVGEEETAALFATCRALLFCGEEDFGITPLEAMASGRPVIAFGRGGALETVVDGETGLFFREPTVRALEQVMDVFETMEFQPDRCVQRAREFGPARFRAGIHAAIGAAVDTVRAMGDR